MLGQSSRTKRGGGHECARLFLHTGNVQVEAWNILSGRGGRRVFRFWMSYFTRQSKLECPPYSFPSLSLSLSLSPSSSFCYLFGFVGWYGWSFSCTQSKWVWISVLCILIRVLSSVAGLIEFPVTAMTKDYLFIYIFSFHWAAAVSFFIFFIL